jgi:DNA mismatch endonuclease Vsr
MADVHSKEIRSNPDNYRQAAIKSKNTKPKMRVRRTVRTLAFRGLNDANLKSTLMDTAINSTIKASPGKPDIVLPKYKTVIFVHRCFWHGHKNYFLPSESFLFTPNARSNVIARRINKYSSFTKNFLAPRQSPS